MASNEFNEPTFDSTLHKRQQTHKNKIEMKLKQKQQNTRTELVWFFVSFGDKIHILILQL